MPQEKAHREFWVKATGHQSETMTTDKIDEIDLTNPGEHRWIYTHIQTVNPGTNSVAKMWKWLHVIEIGAFNDMYEKFMKMADRQNIAIDKLIIEQDRNRKLKSAIEEYLKDETLSVRGLIDAIKEEQECNST